MQLTNSSTRYGAISQLFHWLIAFALIGVFALGIWMVELDYYSTWYHQAPYIHKSIGVLIVLGMVLRFFWLKITPPPLTFENTPEKAHKWLHWFHLSFYLWVILIGFSGYMISTAEGDPVAVFDWFEMPALFSPIEDQADIFGLIHEWLAYGFMALVVLHVLAALLHHFYYKDNTLKRIIN